MKFQKLSQTEVGMVTVIDDKVSNRKPFLAAVVIFDPVQEKLVPLSGGLQHLFFGSSADIAGERGTLSGGTSMNILKNKNLILNIEICNGADVKQKF